MQFCDGNVTNTWKRPEENSDNLITWRPSDLKSDSRFRIFSRVKDIRQTMQKDGCANPGYGTNEDIYSLLLKPKVKETGISKETEEEPQQKTKKEELLQEMNTVIEK